MHDDGDVYGASSESAAIICVAAAVEQGAFQLAK